MIAAVVWDWPRALTVAEAAAIWGLAIWTLVHYARNWFLLQRLPTERRSGLLPAHVALVSAAALVYVTQSTIITVDQLGQNPAWYRLPFTLLGHTLLLIALWVVAHYERRRRAGLTNAIGKLRVVEDPPR